MGPLNSTQRQASTSRGGSSKHVSEAQAWRQQQASSPGGTMLSPLRSPPTRPTCSPEDRHTACVTSAAPTFQLPHSVKGRSHGTLSTQAIPLTAATPPQVPPECRALGGPPCQGAGAAAELFVGRSFLFPTFEASLRSLRKTAQECFHADTEWKNY